MFTDQEPYLSVVIVSRTADLLRLIQVFVTTTLEQCRKLQIPSELIVVERRNGQEGLATTLQLPKTAGPCALRIIEVPRKIRMPAELARDVGIRRARGRFILAAKIDAPAPLPDELMKFIAGQLARYNAVERNDIAVKDGSLVLGKGWFWKELDGSKPFRWFKNEAEISVQPYRESTRILAIDIEPGPRVDKKPARLDVVNDAGSKVASVRLSNRRIVNIPVGGHNGNPIRLRLRVSGAGHRGVSDPRLLKARVMGCGLYDQPVAARAWTIPQRIWWRLTRSAGSSLLPEVRPADTWPDSPHLVTGDWTALRRENWLEGRDKNWGLGSKRFKENRVVESVPTVSRRPRAQVAVDLIGAPIVLFFRAIPRPPLPQSGAFGTIESALESFPPLANPPKISIVTPSYQQGHFLEWTMRSVLEQGYPNLEYVVMDGGSKDGTRDIIERYQDRLTYWESARDAGQADAVVRGFEHTSGEIMAYLNSDDLLAPGALDFVARFMTEHPEVDAIYSHRVFIDEDNIVTRYWILPQHHSWMMQRWDYIPQETCFWRRRIYEKVGGIDKSFQFALDYDLFVRFMREGRMERVNRFLGAFREHASSKTTQQEGAHPEVERVYMEQGIYLADWHRLPQLAQYELLDVRSRKFAAQGKILPGALPGVGYDYNLVWGGRLSAPRSSSRNTVDTHRI